MDKNTKIGIIGLGLIGGSIALKLLKSDFEVFAFDKEALFSKSSSIKAREIELEIELDSYSNLKNCDVVFVCSPLGELENTLKEIQDFLKPGAIVSDVGSVKKGICRFAQNNMRKDCFFIGGHPMAGTEKSGFENALEDLFVNKKWVLIKDSANENINKETNQATKKLKEIIALTGATVCETTAEKHDEAVSFISHLPLFISLSLLKTVEQIKDKEQRELTLSLASSGFEGMVRLAKGNQTLNKDILYSNKEQIEKAFNAFMRESEVLFKNLG